MSWQNLAKAEWGLVYRARDTSLGREVALKVLPESFSHDPDRVARFTREAQVLASLDHPNVAIIYGLERAGTSQIIVMELVEGATLEAKLAPGPLAVAKRDKSESRLPMHSTAVRADVVFPDQAPLWFEEGNSLAMSRDGRMMAWVGGTGSARGLWLRPVDQLDAHALDGTEEATSPFFSPNGEWLGFFTPTALKKIRISGGTSQTLAPVNGRPRGPDARLDASLEI